jgi:hypothetical protein
VQQSQFSRAKQAKPIENITLLAVKRKNYAINNIAYNLNLMISTKEYNASLPSAIDPV